MDSLIEILTRWASINTGSLHLLGLEKLAADIAKTFSSLGTFELISTPQGPLLRLQKRPDAKKQVLLGGHLDTVYSPSHPFQAITRQNEEWLQGPGVADMKGGLLVLLAALQEFEKEERTLGWEILLSPDEEIGSPGSAPFYVAAAKKHQAALIFEPSPPDGSFINRRKGSANYRLMCQGKEAHAGRDFFEGKNAISALIQALMPLEKFSHQKRETTLNIGKIEGGETANIVPSFASCIFNFRYLKPEELESFEMELEGYLAAIEETRGVTFSIEKTASRPPKPYDAPAQHLFSLLERVCHTENLPFSLRSSGGVTDGNLLANAGLPTIDTLGVIGENLHTPDERMWIPSLKERIKLTVALLKEIEATP